MNTLEHPHTINGVLGRMNNRHVWSRTDPQVPERARGLWSTQTWIASRAWRTGKQTGTISVHLRFDDNCRNGHHTFAITGQAKVGRDHEIGGCIHDEIAKFFPELAPLIKWHLCSTDGPMHYAANTIYLAGDRDHRGLRKGETRQLRNGRTGQPCWDLVSTPPTRILPTMVDSAEKPADIPALHWEPHLIVGEGKERDLAAARSMAVWPEATDADLMQEPEALKAVLLARLPALIAAFRADMEACGFAWEAPRER